jgi:filamentous hemagglutinin family protein
MGMGLLKIGVRQAILNVGSVITIGSLLASVWPIASVAAQTVNGIVGDRSLPDPSIVQQVGADAGITGGTIRGSHLFHSFERFSIPTGGSAWFQAAPTLQTIFARVTGNSVSQIDGVLGSSTSLFLLNPNGILFGPNAHLAVSGSFLATTANSFRFADGSEFSAVAPQASPLLTMSVPIGLQFGAQPKPITQQARSLIGAPGQPIALVGGDLNLSGSSLTALGGQITLGSVAAEGLATFKSSDRGFTFDYPTLLPLGNIHLSNGAEVNNVGLDFIGIPAGNIEIQGRSLRLSGNSRILVFNQVNQPSGGIQIRTTESIELEGTGNYEATVRGWLRGTVDPRQVYNVILVLNQAPIVSGDLNLITSRLQLSNGAYVVMLAEGAGSSGKMMLTTETIALSEGILLSSAVQNTKSPGGDVTIKTKQLDARNNSIISTTNIGEGRGGNLTIQADQVRLLGGKTWIIRDDSLDIAYLQINTGLFAASLLQGGDLNITANDITLENEAILTAASNGIAGNLTIKANRFQVHQGAYISTGSTLQSDTKTATKVPEGKGGNITFKIADRTILDQALILATAGELNGNGNSGNVILQTGSLFMNQSLIRTDVRGPKGISGNIAIQAGDSVTIVGSQQPLFIANTVVNQFGLLTGNEASNTGGNIAITSDRFSLSNNAQLNASVDRGNQGGNITVNSRLVEITSGGRLITMARQMGKGGKIEINATERATIQGSGVENSTIKFLKEAALKGDVAYHAGHSLQNPEPMIGFTHPQLGERRFGISQIVGLSAVETGLFASSYTPEGGGSVSITAPQIDILDQAMLSVSSWTTGDSGNLQLNANQLKIEDSLLLSSTMTGRGGAIAIDANQVNLSNSQLIAATAQGTGATLNLQVRDRLILRNNSQITARAFKQGTGGNIQLNTKFLIANPTENNDIIANAFAGKGGNIQINSQGIFGIAVRSPLTQFSDISASAEIAGGKDGRVEINQLSVTPEQTVRELPTTLLQPSTQVAQVCSPKMRRNSLVMTGRGGLPPTPAEMVNLLLPYPAELDPTEPDLKPTIAQSLSSEQSLTPALIEATQWQRHDDGTIALVHGQANASPIVDPSVLRSCAL